MRITDITINNFRAFYGEYRFSLSNKGKNLLLYGENGAGKSSFYKALNTFLESAKGSVPMQGLENIFLRDEERGSAFIELKIKENNSPSSETSIKLSCEVNQIIGNDAERVANANKIKGFFDYKSLLKTHLVHKEEVNLFQLLVEEIFVEQESRFSRMTIGLLWEKIYDNTWNLKQGRHIVDETKQLLSEFNNGVKEKIASVIEDANTFIGYFGYNIKVNISFTGVVYYGRRDLRNQCIDLSINFYDSPLPQHQHFLNEARLSALAISLYLATIKSNPSVGVLKILFLDDLLIGLDMSNRLPLLNIIKEHFEDDYQIFMTTYDKVWYELVQNYFGNQKWKYIELYSKRLSKTDFEIPVLKDNVGYILKAEQYLNENDFKAAAVYLRSEFEKFVKEICNSKQLPVRYRQKQKDMKSDYFWNSIKYYTNIDDDLVRRLEIHRGVVMNPFSHHDLEKPEFRRELEDTLEVIKELKAEKGNFKKSKSITDLRSEINDLKSKIIDKEKTISQLNRRLQRE